VFVFVVSGGHIIFLPLLFLSLGSSGSATAGADTARC
jgi:hypothetical protein